MRETVTRGSSRNSAEGRLDTAIVALPISEPSFTEVALFSESFVLVRPGETRESRLPSRETLREMRLLLLEEGHCFRDQALSFCNMHAARPREFLDGSSLSTLVQMVSVGIGVTLIPEMAVAVETRSAPVSVAQFRPPRPSRTIGMIWRKTSPLARQLLQMSEIVANLPKTCACAMRLPLPRPCFQLLLESKSRQTRSIWICLRRNPGETAQVAKAEAETRDIADVVKSVLRGIWATLLTATLTVTFVISFTTIIYGGSLAPLLETGLGLSLLGAALMCGIGGFFYSFRGTICSRRT